MDTYIHINNNNLTLGTSILNQNTPHLPVAVAGFWSLSLESFLLYSAVPLLLLIKHNMHTNGHDALLTLHCCHY